MADLRLEIEFLIMENVIIHVRGELVSAKLFTELINACGLHECTSGFALRFTRMPFICANFHEQGSQMADEATSPKMTTFIQSSFSMVNGPEIQRRR